MREQSTFNVVHSTKNTKSSVEEMDFLFGLCTFQHCTFGQAVFDLKQYEFQSSQIFATHLIYSREIFVFLRLKFSLQALEFELLKGW
jgi:hypothetical protein